MDWESYFDKPKEISYQIKEIDEGSFSKELAFHEASHFVFQRLLHRYNLGFSEPVHMMIDTVNRNGVVNGFMIEGFNHQFWTDTVLEEFRNFYTQDIRRLKAHCLELMAGYTSYKVFINDSEFFIHDGTVDLNPNKLRMFKLETVYHSFSITRNNRSIVGVSDFGKMKEQASFIGINNKPELIIFYNNLIAEVKMIMNEEAVELAIRYVKNKLLRMDGKIIKGQYFDRIKSFVDNLTKNVNIETYLNIK